MGFTRFITPVLQERYGVDMTFEAIDTDLVSQLFLTGVTAVSRTESGEKEFSLDLQRVEYHFRALDLLHGISSFLQQSRIVVEGGTMAITPAENREDHSSHAQQEDPSLPEKLYLPETVVKDMDIRLSMEDRTLSLNRFSGSMKRRDPDEQGYTIALRSPDLTLARKKALLLSGPVSLDGSFDEKGITIQALRYNESTILENTILAENNNKNGIFSSGKLYLLGIESEFSVSIQKNTVTIAATAQLVDSRQTKALPVGWEITLPNHFTADINVVLNLEHPQLSKGRFAAELEDAVIQGFEVNTLLLNGSISDGICALDQLDIRAGNDQIALNDAAFPLDPLLQGNIFQILGSGSAVFRLSVSDGTSLARLYENDPSDLDILLEKIKIKFAGRLENGRLTGSDASLKAGANKLTIKDFDLTLPSGKDKWRDATLKLTADLLLANPALITSSLHLAEATGTVEGQIELSGSFSAPKGRFVLAGNHLSYKDIAMDHLQVDGRFDDAATLQGNLSIASQQNRYGTLSTHYTAWLKENRLRCRQLQFDHPYGKGDAELEFRLEGDETSVVLHSLNLSSREATMHLIRPVRALLTADSLLLTDPFELTGNSGKVTVKGLLGRTTNNLTIEGVGLNSDHWPKGVPREDIDFNGVNCLLHLKGSMDDPQLALTLRAKRLAVAESPLVFGGDLDVDYSAKGLRITRCRFKDPGSSSELQLEGFLPMVLHQKIRLLPQPLSIQADIDLPDTGILTLFLPGYLQAGGSLKARISLQGSWDQPDGFIDIQAEGLRPSILQDWLPPDPYSIRCSSQLSTREIALTELAVTSPSLRFNLSGNLTFTEKLPAVLLDRFKMPAGNLDIGGTLTLADISPLARNFDAIRAMGGSLTAQLSSKGPVSAPVLEAELQLDQGRIRFNGDFPGIDEIDITAKLRPDNLHIISSDGQLGGSPFHLDGDLFFGKEEDLQLALKLSGKNLLLYRDEAIRLRADTRLALDGPLSHLHLTGNMAAINSMYIKDVSLLGLTQGDASPQDGQSGIRLFSIEDEPLSDMKLDVAITTGEPFLLKNNVAKGSLRPDLLLTGTGRFPELKGVVYLDPIRITLPAGTMHIESGTVRFPANDPDFPELDINGSSRMMGYDVSMQIEGRYDEPVVTLSSSPPLANEELLLMLLAGVRPKAENGSSVMAGGNIALYLGKDLLGSWFKADGEQSVESFLDRLEVDIGRSITRQGDATVEAQLQVAEGVFTPNDTVYLKTEKDMYDQYNTGVRVVFRFR